REALVPAGRDLGRGEAAEDCEDDPDDDDEDAMARDEVGEAGKHAVLLPFVQSQRNYRNGNFSANELLVTMITWVCARPRSCEPGGRSRIARCSSSPSAGSTESP